MQWLIDALRAPLAEVIVAVGSGVAVVFAARVRALARRLEGRVQQVEVGQAVSKPSD